MLTFGHLGRVPNNLFKGKLVDLDIVIIWIPVYLSLFK
jgi:hypothetical protein